MKFIKIAAAALVAASCIAGVALAHGYKIGALEIGHPWTRATAPGAKVGGGYMKITNTGTAPDRLIGGSSAIAGHVEIHEMAMTNGVMIMREVKGGIEIPAGATVELKPGGYHVMFMDLTGQIKEGEKVKGTLKFEKAGSIDVEFAAEKIGAGGMDHSGHDAAKKP